MQDNIPPHGTGRFRRLIRIGIRVVITVPVTVACLILLLQLPPVATSVANAVLRSVNPWEGSTTSIGAVRGNWLSSLSLRDIRILGPEQSLLVSVDTLNVTYNLLLLPRGTLHFRTLDLNHPVVHTVMTDTGLSLLTPFRDTDTTQTSSTPLTVRIDQISLHGGEFRTQYPGGDDSTRLLFSHVRVAAHDIRIAGGVSATIDTLLTLFRIGIGSPAEISLGGNVSNTLLSLRSIAVNTDRSRIAGRGWITLPLSPIDSLPAMDLELDASPVAYKDLHPFIGAFGPEGEASLTLRAKTDGKSLRTEARLRIPRGGSAVVKGTAWNPRRGAIALDVASTTTNLSIAGITGLPDSLERLNTSITLRGEGTTAADFAGTADIEVTQSTYPGLSPVQFAAHGVIDHGTIVSTASGMVGPATFSFSGRIRPLDSLPVYNVAGDYSLLPTAGFSADPAGLAGLHGTLRVAGLGFWGTGAKGRCTLTGRGDHNAHVRGFALEADLRDTTVRASAKLETRSGKADLTGEIAFGNRISYALSPLRFTNIDLGALLGTGIKARLSGSLEMDGYGTSLETISARAYLRLRHSTLMGIGIDTLDVRATTRDGRAQIFSTAATDAGRLAGEVEMLFRPEELSVELKRWAFCEVDAGRVAATEGLRTTLNGTLNGWFRMTSAASLSPHESSLSSASARLLLQESMVNDQPLTGGTVEATLSGGEVSLIVDLGLPGGRVSSTLTARPFQEIPELNLTSLQFEGLDLGKVAGLPGLATELSGTASARHKGKTLAGGTSEVAVQFSRSRVHHEILRNASIRGELDQGSFSAATGWEFDHGRVAGTARGTVKEGAVEGLVATASADFERLDLLAGIDSIGPASLAFNFETEGRFGLPEHTNLRGVLTARGVFDSLRVDSLLCRVLFSGRTVHVETLLVSSNVGTVAATGPLAVFDTSGSSNLTLKAGVRTLAPLKHIVGLSSSGPGSATVSLTGPGGNTRVGFTTELRSASLGENYAGFLASSGSVVLGRGFSLGKLEGMVRGRDLEIGGIGIESGDATVSSDGATYFVAGSAQMEANTRIQLAGAISPGADSTVIVVDTLDFAGPGAFWSLERPVSIVSGRRLTIDDLSLRGMGGSIHAHGLLDPQGEQDFTFSGDSLRLNAVAKFLGRPTLGVLSNFMLRITGPASAAKAEARVNAEFSAVDQPLGGIHAAVDWQDSTLRLDAEVASPGQSMLNVSAQFPATLSLARALPAGHHPGTAASRRPMGFRIRSERFDLSILEPFLNPGTFGKIQGLLTADIAGRGTADSLWLQGSAGLDSGSVHISPLGVTYDQIALRMSLNGDRLVLTRATAHSGQGTLSCSGSLVLMSPDSIPVQATITASDFLAADTPDLKATFSGAVEIKGSLRTPEVSGKVIVKDSYYLVPDLGASGDVEAVELTEEDYSMLRERFGYRRRTVPATPALERSALSADLNVEIERDTWIRKRMNPNLAIELRGGLQVRSRPGLEPFLVGELRPVTGRSFVGQFGRQFEITGGEILLNGSIDALKLLVDSEYKVPSKSGSGLNEVVIRMKVRTDQGRFMFDLTSDPSMSESDILSYLATGKATTGALAQTADQGGLGGAVALEQVVGAASGLTEGKVPLDVFQLRQDGARGITVIAGNYVSQKTYLGIRQPILLEQGSQDAYYNTRTQFELEYQAAVWLFFNLRGGGDRLLMFLKTRHVY